MWLSRSHQNLDVKEFLGINKKMRDIHCIEELAFRYDSTENNIHDFPAIFVK